MTLASTPRVIEYAGDGSTLSFSVPFQFRNAGAIKVWTRDADGVETLKTLTTHYSVSGGAGSTGTVTFLAAPATGLIVAIRGRLTIQQARTWTNGDNDPAAQKEGAFDDAAAIAREAQDQITDIATRAVQVPRGEAAPGFPKLADRVDGAVLGISTDGKLKFYPVGASALVILAAHVGDTAAVAAAINAGTFDAIYGALATIGEVAADLPNIDAVVEGAILLTTMLPSIEAARVAALEDLASALAAGLAALAAAGGTVPLNPFKLAAEDGTVLTDEDGTTLETEAAP